MKSIITVSIAMLAQFAFALPAEGEVSFLDSINPIPIESLSRGSDDNKCSNFSGNWKGHCLGGSGQKVEQTFAIEQTGCNMMKIKAGQHEIPVAIGASAELSVALPAGACNKCGEAAIARGGLTTHWDKDKTSLTLHALASGRHLAADKGPQGFYLREVAKLVDGKLAIDIFHAGEHGKKIMYCVFEK